MTSSTTTALGNRAHVLEGNSHLPAQRDGVIGLSLEVPIKIHPIVGIIVGCHDGKEGPRTEHPDPPG